MRGGPHTRTAEYTVSDYNADPASYFGGFNTLKKYCKRDYKCTAEKNGQSGVFSKYEPLLHL